MVEHKRPRWCSVTQHTVSKSQQIALEPGQMLWPITEPGLTPLYQLTAWLELFNSRPSPFLCCHLFAVEAKAAGSLCKSFQLRGWWEMLGEHVFQPQNKRKPKFRMADIFPYQNKASLIKLQPWTSTTKYNDRRLSIIRCIQWGYNNWGCIYVCGFIAKDKTPKIAYRFF